VDFLRQAVLMGEGVFLVGRAKKRGASELAPLPFVFRKNPAACCYKLPAKACTVDRRLCAC
jgi:hypothetical protein